MRDINGTNELWEKAIENGTVKAVDSMVYHQGEWCKVSTSFYDTKEANEDGFYHQVGYYTWDLNVFNTVDRMANKKFVETDREAEQSYRNGEISSKMLHLNNDKFDYFVVVKREREKRNAAIQEFMFDKQHEIAESLDITSPIPLNEYNLQRHCVRVFTNNGSVWDTEINGTRKSVLNYFLGQSYEADENLPTEMVVVVLFGEQTVPKSSFTKERALSALEQWKKGMQPVEAVNDPTP